MKIYGYESEKPFKWRDHNAVIDGQGDLVISRNDPYLHVEGNGSLITGFYFWPLKCSNKRFPRISATIAAIKFIWARR